MKLFNRTVRIGRRNQSRNILFFTITPLAVVILESGMGRFPTLVGKGTVIVRSRYAQNGGGVALLRLKGRDARATLRNPLPFAN